MSSDKLFRAPQSTFRRASDIASEARQEMQILNQHPGALGLSTGLPCLDDAMSAALEPGRLLVVLGQSGGGKSALLSQLSVAFASQVPTLLLTLEDSERDLTKRMLSMIARVDVSDVRNGFAGKTIPGSVDDAITALSELNLNVSADLREQPTILDIGRTISEWKKQNASDHGVVIIDQLSHIADTLPDDPFFRQPREIAPPPPPYRQHDVLEWKVAALRHLAKKSGLTVVLAHQLNDQVSDTEKPSEKSVRGSRGVLHKADAVIAVYVPKTVENMFAGQGDEKYLANESGDGLIISLKARTVQAFEVPVRWLGEQQRFAERQDDGRKLWAAVPTPSPLKKAGSEKMRLLRERFDREGDDRIEAANKEVLQLSGVPAIEPADRPSEGPLGPSEGL